MSATPRDGGPVIDPEDPTGPGAQLREARHRANLSLEEVATQLRLDRRTVRALEENEFQYLPAPTFIRGYIRSYARLLGLPPGPILDAYDYQGFNAPDLLADITQRPQARFSDFPVRLATLVVAGGLVAMVVMWWHSRESPPEMPSQVELVANAPDDPAAATGSAADRATSGTELQQPPAPEPPAQELVAAEDSSAAPSGSAENIAPPEAGAVSESLAGEVSTPATPSQRSADTASATVQPEAPAAGTRSRTVPVRDALVTALNPPERQSPSSQQSSAEPTTPSRLVIRFSQESWVEIFDADGIRREFRLATPGSRTSVNGTPPFHVLLGYAEGAMVTFDGEDYDISRFIRGDTARFLIGPDGLKKARRPEPVESTAETASESSRAPSEAAASQLPSDSAIPDAN